MRIAVALVPVLAFAATWQPVHGQNPSGGYVSSLMPMPRVAQYSAPSTRPSWSRPYDTNGPAWGYNAAPPAAPMYQAPYSGYGAGSWNSASYRPVSTPGNPGDPHYAGPPAQPAPYANQPAPYANQPAPVPQHEQPYYPQPQAAPNQYYQQYGAAASGGGAYVDAAGAAGGACDGYGYGAGYGGGYGAGYGAGYGEAYGYDAGNGYGYGGGYGYGSVLGSQLFNRGGCCHWQVSAAALFMGRIDNNQEWFSYIDGADEIQLGNGIENFGAGVEIGLTRRFCCASGTYAFQAKYWGIFPTDWETSQSDDGYGSSIFSVYDFDPLVVDHPDYPGTPIAVNDYYDGAQLHVVRRSWEVHNLEVNLLGGGLLGDGINGWGMAATDGLCGGGACGSACGGAYGGACGGGDCKAGGCGGAACGYGDCCGPRLNMGWLFGVRFLYFNDSLQFATDQVDHDWNWDLDEMYYDIDVDNYLIGLQLGYGGDWCITPKLHLRTGTKFGVYGTHINHVSQIHGEMGNAYVSAGPNAGYEYDVHSSETSVSFLGEIDVALAYHITPRCVGKVGYRVVAVTGVAVADGQIPRHFAGIQDVADIDAKDNLVLHGAYVGLEYCW